MRSILAAVTVTVLLAGCSSATALPSIPTPDPLEELRRRVDACVAYGDVLGDLTDSLGGFTRERGEKLARVKQSLNRVTHPDLMDARANLSVAIDYWLQSTSYRIGGDRLMADAAAGLARTQTNVALSHFKAACG